MDRCHCLVGLIAVGVVLARHRARADHLRALIATLEREHPELRHLLPAAAEQEPDAASGNFRFLQLRAIEAVLDHPNRHRWKESIERKLSSALTGHLAALAAALLLLVLLGYNAGHPVFRSWLAAQITVDPGDTQIERGSSLVISARLVGSRRRRRHWSWQAPRARPCASRWSGIWRTPSLARA